MLSSNEWEQTNVREGRLAYLRLSDGCHVDLSQMPGGHWGSVTAIATNQKARNPGMMVHAFAPSTWKAEVDISVKSRPVYTASYGPPTTTERNPIKNNS